MLGLTLFRHVCASFSTFIGVELGSRKRDSVTHNKMEGRVLSVICNYKTQLKFNSNKHDIQGCEVAFVASSEHIRRNFTSACFYVSEGNGLIRFAKSNQLLFKLY